MKVHANAALGPAGRLALVKAIESGMTLRAAAQARPAEAAGRKQVDADAGGLLLGAAPADCGGEGLQGVGLRGEPAARRSAGPAPARFAANHFGPAED
jgi:hypothetical protein